MVAKELHWPFSSIWRNEEEGLWRHESVEDKFLQYHTTCHALENPNCVGLAYHEAFVVHSSGDGFSRMKENSCWVERAWGESTPRAQLNSSMHSRELLGQKSWCPSQWGAGDRGRKELPLHCVGPLESQLLSQQKISSLTERQGILYSFYQLLSPLWLSSLTVAAF